MTIYIYKGSLHLKKNNVKLTQITQKWPLKDLPGTVCLWSVPLYIILGESGHFGSEKGVKSAPKWLQQLAIGPLNVLNFVMNCPKMTPK